MFITLNDKYKKTYFYGLLKLKGHKGSLNKKIS